MRNEFFFLLLGVVVISFSTPTISHKALIALMRLKLAQRKGGRIFVDNSEFVRSPRNGKWVLVERNSKLK